MEENFRDQLYQIRLEGGRVLGPLDLERIRLLILKGQIAGVEVARELPNGEWKDINTFTSIAGLLVAHAAGELKKESSKGQGIPYKPILGTQVDRGAKTEVVNTELKIDQPLPTDLEIEDEGPAERAPEHDSERTVIAHAPPRLEDSNDDDRTMIGELEERSVHLDVPAKRIPGATDSRSMAVPDTTVSATAGEKTVMLERDVRPKAKLAGEGRSKARNLIKATAMALMLGLLGYEVFLQPEPKKSGTQVAEVALVRARLPSYKEGNPDPARSTKLYTQAMKHYIQDTVIDYREAVKLLHEAVSLDVSNAKALAMLASSYLNLIDSSNKDENYFSVISKLIEMSKVKSLNLPETVIAETEFYVTVNKAEAAQNLVVEYTKNNRSYHSSMFYYLAFAYNARGDYVSAARYLSQYPDNQVFSAKVFYLRGRVAENLNDSESALTEYGKALNLNKSHMKSRLRIASLHHKTTNMAESRSHLEAILAKPALLTPKELAEAYFLRSLLSSSEEKWDQAIADVEKARNLDRGKHAYLLEYYTLRAKRGDPVASIQKEARMYYYLSEGEKRLKDGEYQEALTQFLRAREENLTSPLPLVKTGDMFHRMGDIVNARENFRLAAEKAPKDIDIWSRYMDMLIQSYEWDEAQKAMEKFRKLPVSQSAIDKAAADMYAKQGQHAEAQMYYKKAMARETVDPDVYIAYAKSLMAVRNFKDAPFFFALALRFDPLSFEAIVGTATCIANSESIDRAITMLQDELSKGTVSRVELMSAIAEFYLQKGDLKLAQQFVEQGMNANPEASHPWKVQAQIYLAQEGSLKDALGRALLAYQSYSDRNPSEPTGYFERYKVFIKKTQFEKAADELSKIYAIYPKYPSLHFYKGAMYTAMGNSKAAIEEYRVELKNNPKHIDATLALGKELILVGDVKGALDRFNEAMQLQPYLADPKHYSGYANYLMKNYAGAIALYRSALVYDQGSPLIWKRLGMAYRDSGDGRSAGDAFKKYLELEPDAPDRGEFQRFL